MEDALTSIRAVPGAQLALVGAPYDTLLPLLLGKGNPQPPLGSVVYATGQSVLAVLEQLAVAIEKWPWLAPCAGLPSTEYVAEKYAALNRLLGPRLAVVRLHAGQSIAPAAAANAVALRQKPGAASLAGWVCTRLAAYDLATPLMDQFAYALGEQPRLPHTASRYSRAFTPHGRLTARDWRAVARLIHTLHCHVVQDRLPGSNQDRGGDAPLSLRTTQHYSVKYLGRAWGWSKRLVGWEWILESVLRGTCGRSTASRH